MSNGMYVLAVVGVIAGIWLITLIWYIVTWEQNRRRDRARRNRAIADLARRSRP
jgi:hypothetical protein